MTNTITRTTVILLIMVGLAIEAYADSVSRADSHAPIGILGDHLHKAGEFMFSYRYARMSMSGNSDSGASLSADDIATSALNPFFGRTGQPPTLRVVPTKMSMSMQMVGLMYAPTDWLTLMGMVGTASKEMDHSTYQGAAGTTVLGNFRVKTQGQTDSTIYGLIHVGEWGANRLHATVGLSIPTGSIEKTATVLAPNSMQRTLRAPYPMQLGSGTYDGIVGLTYSHSGDRWGFGSQWRSVMHLGTNDEGYALGDEHKVNVWTSYSFANFFSVSARAEFFSRGNIDGFDASIVAPVQTADPNRQKAKIMRLAVGANTILGNQHRIGLELLSPIKRSLHGPQLEDEWSAILGYQIAF